MPSRPVLIGRGLTTQHTTNTHPTQTTGHPGTQSVCVKTVNKQTSMPASTNQVLNQQTTPPHPPTTTRGNVWNR